MFLGFREFALERKHDDTWLQATTNGFSEGRRAGVPVLGCDDRAIQAKDQTILKIDKKPTPLHEEAKPA
jgi:hypothetical protein